MVNWKDEKVKKIVVYILLVVSIIFEVSSLGYLYSSLTHKDNEDDRIPVMEYTQKGGMDYKVYLKSNDFIEQEYLNQDEAYILNLIDHIRINSFYNFRASDITKAKGNSKLIANLKVYYRESTDKDGNPVVLNKEYIIEDKDFKFEKDRFSNNVTYDLKLDKYLKILKDFQNEVKISVDGYLEISYVTNLNGEVEGFDYNNDYKSLIKIPLSSSVIKITNNKEETKVSKVFDGQLLTSSKILIVLVVIVSILVFGLICYLIKRIFMLDNRSAYEKEVSKLLKNYDDIIVNTNTAIDLEKYKIIEISEFKEILNLANELLLPIMNYEVIEGQLSWFYVIKGEILYRYIVSTDKFVFEKDVIEDTGLASSNQEVVIEDNETFDDISEEENIIGESVNDTDWKVDVTDEDVDDSMIQSDIIDDKADNNTEEVDIIGDDMDETVEEVDIIGDDIDDEDEVI